MQGRVCLGNGVVCMCVCVCMSVRVWGLGREGGGAAMEAGWWWEGGIAAQLRTLDAIAGLPTRLSVGSRADGDGEG